MYFRRASLVSGPMIPSMGPGSYPDFARASLSSLTCSGRAVLAPRTFDAFVFCANPIPVGTAASRIDARITIPARVTWLWPMAITSWPTRVASSVPVVLVTGLRLLRALSPKAGTRRPAQRCHSVASSGCQSNDSGFPRRVSVSTGKMFLPRSNLPNARPR